MVAEMNDAVEMREDAEQVGTIAGVPSREVIGKRIYQARKGAGLSQARLGALLGGLAHVTVLKMEQGAIAIPVERLVMIAVATGRPIGWFLRPEGADEPDVAAIDAETAALDLAARVRDYGWYDRVSVRRVAEWIAVGEPVWVVTGWHFDGSGLIEIATWENIEGFDRWVAERPQALRDGLVPADNNTVLYEFSGLA